MRRYHAMLEGEILSFKEEYDRDKFLSNNPTATLKNIVCYIIHNDVVYGFWCKEDRTTYVKQNPTAVVIPAADAWKDTNIIWVINYEGSCFIGMTRMERENGVTKVW